MIREANEELFGRADAGRVTLVSDLGAENAGSRPVRVRYVRTELGLRDIRYAATEERPVINVTYHAAMYVGRTALKITDFNPQQEELAGLEYFAPEDVDRMLVKGALAPNMGFLWFALGGLVSRSRGV